MICGGELAIAAISTADIDAQLVATTGCGIDEIEPLLASGPDRAALALMPLLEEPMELLDLARLIAADPAATGEIRSLYAELSAASDAPVPIEADTEPVPPPAAAPPLETKEAGA